MSRRRRRVGGFSPHDLPDKRAWWDANNLQGQASGSAVDTWTDKWSAIPLTAITTARPTVNHGVAALNNKSGVLFASPNVLNYTVANLWAADTTGYAISVVRPGVVAADSTVWASCSENDGHYVIHRGSGDTGPFQKLVEAEQVKGSIAVAGNISYIQEMWATGGASVLMQNGVVETNVGTDTGKWFSALSSTRDNFTIGAIKLLGANPGQHYDGYICQVLITGSVPNAATRLQIRNYFNQMYAVY